MFGARVDVLNNRATGPKRFSLKRRRSTDSVERESKDDKEQQKDIELQSDEVIGSDKSENDESESESESDEKDGDDDSDEKDGDNDSDEKDGDDDSDEKVGDDDSDVKDGDDDSDEKVGDEDNSDMNVDDTTTYPTLDTTSSDNYTSKHSRIFSKFQHTLAKQPEDESDEHESEDVDMQDLAPLPQPELPSDRRLRAVNTHSQNLDWLAEPIYAKPANTAPFSSFGLSTFMQHNLTKLGFESAFSVQIEVLKLALKDLEANKLQPDTKGDILVNAATGSGKTLAYLIPIIEALHTRVVPRLRAVVIVPTRPLIGQVFTTMVSLAAGTNLRISTLKLDVSLKEESVKLAENVPDIVITTPGRLVDHLNNKTLDLAVLRYLVIDEADRLLNQSFQNWCEILHANMTTEVNVAEKWHVAPKKMVFSATLTTDAALLAQLKFIRPRLVVVNEHDELVNELFTIPASLTEYHIRMGDSHLPMKPLILARFLIERNKLANVLVFTKSNEASLRLATILGLLMDKLAPSKVRVAYLNSTNNKKGLRTKILKEFCDREVGILVATDLISRGIDVASITDVVNYDLPHSAREYVHRVGRTARANQHGDAWTITYGYGESRFFHLMGRSIGRGGRMVQEDDFIIRRSILDGDERVYEECLKELERLVKGKDEERR